MKALKNLKRPSRLSVFSGIAAVFLGFLLQIGAEASYAREINFLAIFLGGVVYSVLLFFLIRKLFTLLDRKPDKPVRRKKQIKFSWKHFFIFFGIIMACWIPIFLAYYPGAFAYDVEYQMSSPGLNGHHPLIHNLFLRGTVGLGEAIFGQRNLAIAFHTIIQMTIIGSVFAYICEALRRFGHKYLHRFAVAFVGLMPFCSYMAISATKDAMFIAFFALSLMLIYELLTLETITKKRITATAIIVALASLFRNNAPYIMIAWAIVIALFFWRSRFFKAIAKATKVSVMVACVGGLVFAGAFHCIVGAITESPEDWEAAAPYSVPLHLLDAVITKYPEYREEQNLEDGKIFGLFDPALIDDVSGYCTTLADCAKNTIGLAVTKDNRKELLAKTIEMGIKHPVTYATSYVALMKSSWYPYSYDYYSIYGTKDPWGNEDTGFREGLTRPTVMNPYVETTSFLPHLKSFLDYEWLNLGYSHNFVLNLLLSPGSYVLALIVFVLYAWYSRRYGMMMLAFLPVLAYGTILIGPCVLIRYMAPIMVTVPMLYVMMRYGSPVISKPATKSLKNKR